MPDASDFEFNWDEETAESLFDAYSRFGNSQTSFRKSVPMTGKNLDKWLKEAGVIDGTTVTTIITGIAFSKETGRSKKTIDYDGMKNVLVNIAVSVSKKDRGDPEDNLNDMCAKMAKVKAPSTENSTKTATGRGVYDRLTNPDRERNKRRKSVERRKKDGYY